MANDNPSALGAGDVPIVLDGTPAVLRPSYMAFRTISAQFGGVSGAVQKVSSLDVQAIETVIALGLGYGGNRPPPKDLGERIWRTGLSDASGALVERVTTYLLVLINGGKMPSQSEVDAMLGEEDAGDPPQT